MNNIINLGEIDISKYVPRVDDDFERLKKYKPKILFGLLRYDNKHRDLVIEHLFFRLKSEEDIEEFKNTLKDIKVYDDFVKKIKISKNDKYKQHLALYYENSLVDEIYNGEYNLAKQIYKNRKKYGPRDYCYDHLLKLASIADDYTTLLLIKDELTKLVKESTRATYFLNIYQLLFQGKVFSEEHRLNIKDDEKFLIDDFTEEAERTYMLHQKRKKNIH